MKSKKSLIPQMKDKITQMTTELSLRVPIENRDVAIPLKT
jgi:hypothetical protein